MYTSETRSLLLDALFLFLLKILEKYLISSSVVLQ